jgi:hypothetical protein
MKHLTQRLRYLYTCCIYTIYSALITELQTIEVNKVMGICTFDIANMYTIVPKIDTDEHNHQYPKNQLGNERKYPK